MGGDALLSEMKATYFAPTVQPAFMGAMPPFKNGYGSLYQNGHVSYFQNYRNENLSKFQMPPYDWGFMDTPYTARPDIAVYSRTHNPDLLAMPRPQFTMVDSGRNKEVDDFYKSAQLHRDQYKDHSGRLHPLKYYKSCKYPFECPDDPTSVYLRAPQTYTKYKDPIVLPVTLRRTQHTPNLPERSLTGHYAPSSDISYKR